MLKKLALGFLMVSASAAMATTYNGNGNTGFGGSVGGSNLSITDSGGALHFTLNTGSGLGGNDLVFYLDSKSGGFGDTSQFSDAADGGRRATSGFSGGGTPTRTTANFPVGFNADFALTLGDTFGVQFGLVAGGDNSLTVPGGLTNFSHTGNTFTFDVSLTSLGLNQGDSFSFVGSLISETAFRSDEGYGAVSSTGNPGFAGTITYTSVNTYTTTAVPEPSSLALLAGPAILGAWFFVRRRRA